MNEVGGTGILLPVCSVATATILIACCGETGAVFPAARDDDGTENASCGIAH